MVSDLTLKNHDEPNIAHSTKKTQSTPASIHISRSLSSMQCDKMNKIVQKYWQHC